MRGAVRLGRRVNEDFCLRGLGGGWHGRALRREVFWLGRWLGRWSSARLCHEGVKVVHEFFGSFGPLVERRVGGGGAGRGGRRLPGAVLRFGRPCDHAATSSSTSSGRCL